MSSPSISSLSVVVVEDNVESNNLLRDWLKLKYRVSCFFDAESTVRLLPSSVEPVVFLVDFNLPVANGFWLRHQLDAKFPAARYILVSGLFDEKLRAEALAQGFHALLSKPFSMQLLAQTIDTLIGTGAA